MTATQFMPGGTLTRAQACAMITRLLGDEALAIPSSTDFSDVPESHWASGYVAYCSIKGIVNGVGDGKFDPEGELTGFAWAKMLLCALGYNAEREKMTGGSWKIAVNILARETGLFGDCDFDNSLPCPRAIAAQYAFNLLPLNTVSYNSAGNPKKKKKSFLETYFDINSLGEELKTLLFPGQKNETISEKGVILKKSSVSSQGEKLCSLTVCLLDGSIKKLEVSSSLEGLLSVGVPVIIETDVISGEVGLVSYENWPEDEKGVKLSSIAPEIILSDEVYAGNDTLFIYADYTGSVPSGTVSISTGFTSVKPAEGLKNTYAFFLSGKNDRMADVVFVFDKITSSIPTPPSGGGGNTPGANPGGSGTGSDSGSGSDAGTDPGKTYHNVYVLGNNGDVNGKYEYTVYINGRETSIFSSANLDKYTLYETVDGVSAEPLFPSSLSGNLGVLPGTPLLTLDGIPSEKYKFSGSAVIYKMDGDRVSKLSASFVSGNPLSGYTFYIANWYDDGGFVVITELYALSA
ncbi:MAG: S-layer homology domain-containing protein [Oscillospiraceae bacterium]|nr:S-layer homology domain-containing protein [Oscillospiraceae bacterium]